MAPDELRVFGVDALDVAVVTGLFDGDRGDVGVVGLTDRKPDIARLHLGGEDEAAAVCESCRRSLHDEEVREVGNGDSEVCANTFGPGIGQCDASAPADVNARGVPGYVETRVEADQGGFSKRTVIESHALGLDPFNGLCD